MLSLASTTYTDIPVLHLNGKGEFNPTDSTRMLVLICSHHTTEIARHRLNQESVLDQIKQATNQNVNEK